jgi:hypothetical protein
MEAAVDVDDLAGGERQQVGRDDAGPDLVPVMPCSASRAAYRAVIMTRPALARQ